MKRTKKPRTKKVAKQSADIDIKQPFEYHNMDEFVEGDNTSVILPPKHFLAPKLFFCMLILGKTGCGKTNHIVDLLFHILQFDRVYLFAANLKEEKYQLIIERMKEAEEEEGIQ